jgi:hypothetical protein
MATLHRPVDEPAAFSYAARFDVTTPDYLRMGPFGGPKISPDGRRLVWGSSINGTGRLWIRRLDSASIQPLAGTEHGGNAFWSPDSRSIGFFADGRLKRVDVDGGPVLTLCDTPGYPRGAWGSNGVILFSPSGIYRVPDTGGVPHPVTELDTSRSETQHILMGFLSDGRRFLFRERARTGNFFVGSVDSPRARQPITIGGPADSVLDLSPTRGYLIYAKRGTILAQSFDEGRLEPRGPPITLADDAWSPPSASRTGLVVFRRRGLLFHATHVEGSRRPCPGSRGRTRHVLDRRALAERQPSRCRSSGAVDVRERSLARRFDERRAFKLDCLPCLAVICLNGRTASARAAGTPAEKALRFFEALPPGELRGALGRFRPARIRTGQLADALNTLPAEGELTPDSSEAAKLARLESILAYHGRLGVVVIKLIDLPQAGIGLYARSILLLSRSALDMLTATELQAVVAHELGHEYFWDDYQRARKRGDMPALQEVELKCDGIAALALIALGLHAGVLESAVRKVARFNEALGATANAAGTPILVSAHDSCVLSLLSAQSEALSL